MTNEQFKAARTTLGLTQAKFAALLRIKGGARSVRRYESGAWPVDGPLSVAVEAALDGWRDQT